MKLRIKEKFIYTTASQQTIAYIIQKKTLFGWRDVKELPIAFGKETAESLMEWYKNKD